MSYKLGPKSLDRLAGVHPDLVRVVRRAIDLTSQDFSVHEGLRSKATQADYVKRGASRTMNSLHLLQPDGFGHAVDLVPYAGGQLRWEWPLIYPIAAAMQRAAIEVGVALTWGGVWDRNFNLLQKDAGGMAAEVSAYCVRHPGPDFIDGPHYQLGKG